MGKFVADIQYNPIRAVVTEAKTGKAVEFDIIPAHNWLIDDVAWEESERCAWEIAERVIEVLEQGTSIDERQEVIWLKARSAWYPPLDASEIDQEADLEEAKREWEGTNDYNMS